MALRVRFRALGVTLASCLCCAFDATGRGDPTDGAATSGDDEGAGTSSATGSTSRGSTATTTTSGGSTTGFPGTTGSGSTTGTPGTTSSSTSSSSSTTTTTTTTSGTSSSTSSSTSSGDPGPEPKRCITGLDAECGVGGRCLGGSGMPSICTTVCLTDFDCPPMAGVATVCRYPGNLGACVIPCEDQDCPHPDMICYDNGDSGHICLFEFG